ncbi:MAG: tetratricopeptide repeat protein [bacterium]|nr:tetratricopeptide repeat protein [bacterium]
MEFVNSKQVSLFICLLFLLMGCGKKNEEKAHKQYQIGEEFHRVRMYELAIKQYQEIIDLYPKSRFKEIAEKQIKVCEKSALIQKEFDEVLKLKKEKRYLETINGFLSFVEKHPETELVHEAIYQIGLCYEEEGDFDKVCEYLEKVAQIHPSAQLELKILKKDEERFQEGLTLMKEERYSEAQKAFSAVKKKHLEETQSKIAKIKDILKKTRKQPKMGSEEKSKYGTEKPQPAFKKDKRLSDARYIKGQDKGQNNITRYNPEKIGIGIIRGDELDDDKLLAAQMSFYLYAYNEHCAISYRPLAPQPRKRTDPFQAFVNGACYWFSCDVKRKPTISIRDINGVEDTYNINDTPAKGFDSEMTVAKFLWRFNNPTAIWDVMYKPTLSISHSGYNLQDMINELTARGYGLDWLLDEIGLRPILGTVTNFSTNKTIVSIDMNGILLDAVTVKLEVSNDYIFSTLVYSATLSGHGTSIITHTLSRKLKDGLYFWRVKVLDKNLPNLYSDIGTFEMGDQSEMD